MLFLLVLGVIGLSLYHFNKETVRHLQNYEDSVNKEGGGENYPVDFHRPPKQIWGDISTLIYEPGMPEGLNAKLPGTGSFHDQGIFGAPKYNIEHSNILYPFYRTDCLYL